MAESIAGITTALCLTGCVTSGQKQVSAQPNPQPARAIPTVNTSPASRPLVVARPVVVEQVVPEPNNVYISGAANGDVVFVGDSTYIWVT
ncbi:MAG: hypothetical protein WBR17_29480, partial [Paraburkholderia sp.]